MSLNDQKKALFWQLADLHDDDKTMINLWISLFNNPVFGKQGNMSKFLQEAADQGENRFTAPKATPLFQAHYKDAAQETQVKAAPPNEILPLMEQDLPLPPLAAARQAKASLQAAARVQLKQAGERAKEAARQAWDQKLDNEGHVFSFTFPVGISTIFKELMKDPLESVHWAGRSFEDENSQVEIMKRVFKLIQDNLSTPARIRILDTNKKGTQYPVARPDFTITAEDLAYNEAFPSNIPWSVMVGTIELK